MSFFSKLARAIEHNQSLLCVGLDPRVEHLTPGGNIEAQLTDWGKGIIDRTADQVCCYKPNFAFYEQCGPAGLNALQATVRHVPGDIPLLLDVKRGDIGSTASAYAAAAYEQWGAEAVTLSPYLGEDGVRPFLEPHGKAVFLLCYTSNPSARQVQEHGSPPLYEHIARLAQTWGDESQVGLVVGATQPQALRRVRKICPRIWILAPGVGAQGGSLKEALRAGLRADRAGLIIPVSRGVIFEANVRQAAQALRAQIRAEIANLQPELEAESPLWPLAEALFRAGCVQFGSFTLASGAQSPVYIDLRRAVSFPALFSLMVDAYINLLDRLSFDHIASVPYAALPAGAVVASRLGASLIYPRKEVKDHGTGKKVEGSFQPGQRAVLLEDVVTSGGSILTAAEALRAVGLTVHDAVVLVDRQQGGADELHRADIRLHAVMRMTDLLAELKRGALIDATTFDQVKGYLDGTSGH